MKKTLTQKETLKSGSNVTYFKLHFGKQYFMVMPWHYTPAKLDDVFKACSEATEGVEYDIKWRDAKISGRAVTLLTQITPVEEEFVWVSDEIGGEDASNRPSEARGEVLGGQPKQPYQFNSASPLEALTEDCCPMCNLPFKHCTCEIPF